MLNNEGGFKSRPKALMCYICGREYGTKSLEIHIKTCIKKWEIEEGKKPRKERRPLPQPPKEFNNVMGKEQLDWKEVEQYNEIANDKWSKECLIRCDFCNRTFLENRIPGHKKICTAERPFKPLIRPADQSQSESPEIKHQANYSPQKNAPINHPIQKSMGGQGNNMGSGGMGGGQGSNIGGGMGGGQKNNMGGSSHTQAYNKSVDEGPPIKGNKKPVQEYEEYEEAIDLVDCQVCGRKFAADRIQKHMTVCQKVAVKSKKHEDLVAKAYQKSVAQQKEVKKLKPKGDPQWKKQHEELVESMKYNRQVKKCEESGGDFSKLKPPPSSNYDHYIECPYCGRKYDQTVAERHIPKCKDIINKPNPVKKPSMSQTNSPYKASNSTNSPYKAPTGSPQKSSVNTGQKSYGGGFNQQSVGGKSGFGGGAGHVLGGPPGGFGGGAGHVGGGPPGGFGGGSQGGSQGGFGGGSQGGFGGGQHGGFGGGQQGGFGVQGGGFQGGNKGGFGNANPGKGGFNAKKF